MKAKEHEFSWALKERIPWYSLRFSIRHHALFGLPYANNILRPNYGLQLLILTSSSETHGRFVAGLVVQGQALARGLLPVQQVPRVTGGQAVRLQVGQDLLRQLLRCAVRLPLRRLWPDLQSW